MKLYIIKTVLVVALVSSLIAFWLSRSVSPAHVSDNEVASPPMFAVEGRHLIIDLPTGWQIVRRDPLSRWPAPVASSKIRQGNDEIRKTCYSFIASHESGKLNMTARVDVQVETFLGSWCKAGSFRGVPFTSISGVKGIAQVGPTDYEDQDSWFMIDSFPYSPKGSITVNIHLDRSGADQQQSFASFVFRHLHFTEYLPTDSRLQAVHLVTKPPIRWLKVHPVHSQYVNFAGRR